MRLYMLLPLSMLAVLTTACGAGPVSIAGRVVDHRGTPVSRAEVVTAPETDVVVTNSRGFFVLRQRINDMGGTEPIPPGEYTIKVRKFGFDELGFKVLVEGGPVRVADLALQPRTAEVGDTAPEVTEERETAPDGGSTPMTGI